MSSKKISAAWSAYQSSFLWWLGVSVLGLTFAKDGWRLLVQRSGEFYDAGNYTTIATDGYTVEGLAAFYPLWPMLLRVLTFGSINRQLIGNLGGLLSCFFFVLSCYFVFDWSEKQKLAKFRPYVLALMVLSPLSLFRVLSFTESLFSLALVLLVNEFSTSSGRASKVFILSFLLSSMRPMFPFLMVAAGILMILEVLDNKTLKSDLQSDTHSKPIAMLLGAPLGYLPFAWFCHKRFGNFWMPFDVQVQWGRKFSFHWDLILSPKVINGSNEVLVWDLIAFYLPLILFGWCVYQIFKNPRIFEKNLLRATLLAALIGCAHSAAAFLTFGRFMSIGRHVLANPLPYMALLVALQAVPQKYEVLTSRVLKFVIFASVIFLGMWWVRFSRDQWIG